MRLTIRTLLLAASTLSSAQGQPFLAGGKAHLDVATNRGAGWAISDTRGADVNGDGHPDLLFSFAGGGTQLHLGNADGQFAAAPPLPYHQGAIALPGDVDGDGDLDLVTLPGGKRVYGARGGEPSCLLGDGTGMFRVPRNLRFPARSMFALDGVLADLDGDLDLDVLVSSNYTAAIELLAFENDGQGHFTTYPRTFPPLTEDAVKLRVADLNGDALLDVVYSDKRSANAHLLLQDPAGDFVRSPLGAGHVHGIVDWNQDGFLDVVIGSGILLGNGTGSGWTRLPFAHQVGGDGRSEIVDFDLDGRWDLVILEQDDLQIYIQDSSGSLVQRTSTWLPTELQSTRNEEISYPSLWVQDLDGNRAPDLVLASAVQHGMSTTTAGRLPKLLLNHHTYFVDATERPFPYELTDTVAAAAADVDGDGDQDLFMAHDAWLGRRGENVLWINDGRGSFTSRPGPVLSESRSFTGPRIHSADLLFEDFDGDGDLDACSVRGSDWFNQLGGPTPNILAFNDGNGVFQTQMFGSGSSSCVAAGDVDGDGDQDLVIGNIGNGFPNGEQNRLWLNDGTGTFTDVTGTHLPVRLDTTMDLELGDLDGDGDLDLALSNIAFSSQPDLGLQIWINDGTGRFQDLTPARVRDNADRGGSLDLGDLDGDGDLDVAVCERTWENDGTGHFTLLNAGNIGAFDVVRLEDLNGDGIATMILGTTDHLIVEGVLHRYGWQANHRQPVVFDIDGDQDLDIFSPTAQPIMGAYGELLPNLLLVNADRQLEAPFVARTNAPYELRFHVEGPSHKLALPFLAAGTRTQPIQIAPFGAFFLDTPSTIPLPLVQWNSGAGSLTATLPALPELSGLPLACQALVGSAADPMAARFTNFTMDFIGR